MAPIREHYMAEKIAAHSRLPLLIMIGEQHVKALEKLDLDDAAFHPNHNAFEEYTEAP